MKFGFPLTASLVLLTAISPVITVAINCIDAKNNELTMIGDSFEASHLGELGEGFLLRGVFDWGERQRSKLQADIIRYLSQKRNISQKRTSPSELTISNDNLSVRFVTS